MRFFDGDEANPAITQSVLLEYRQDTLRLRWQQELSDPKIKLLKEAQRTAAACVTVSRGEIVTGTHGMEIDRAIARLSLFSAG